MKVSFSSIRAQQMKGFARRIAPRVSRGLDRVGEWLFPNPQSLVGWQPATLGPQLPTIALAKATNPGGGGVPSDGLEHSKQELCKILKKKGYRDTSALDRVFPHLRHLPQPNVERNLRVAFRLAEWQVSPTTVAASLLADAETLPAKLHKAVKDTVTNRHRLNSFTCDFEETDQVDRFRSLLFSESESHEALLMLAAEDTVDLEHYSESEETVGTAKAGRAFHATAWILKYLGYGEEAGRLEDLGLLHFDPEQYDYALALQKKEAGMGRAEALKKLRGIAEKLDLLLTDHGFSHRLVYRLKKVASTARKVEAKGRAQDLHGIRIILSANEARECYRALLEIKEFLERGIADEAWEEDPDKFDDHITHPKPNDYQSLHALFRDLEGFPLEIQIRTEEMDHIAEIGTASHAGYKTEEEAEVLSGGVTQIERAAQRFQAKKAGMQEAGVYFIYDDWGKLHKLVTGNPRHAPTVLDFAFAFGAKTGLLVDGGFIDGRPAELIQPLQSGQVVNLRVSTAVHITKHRLQNVFTSFAKAVLTVAWRTPFEVEELDDTRKLASQGAAYFNDQLLPAISRELSPHFSRFKVSPPQLVFSLDRIYRRMGFDSPDQFFLAIGIAARHSRSPLIAEIQRKILGNLILISHTSRTRSTEFEMMAVNRPGVLAELLSLSEKHKIRITSLKQAVVPASPYVFIQFNGSWRHRRNLGSFLEELRDLYGALPLPLILTQRNINISLGARKNLPRANLIQAIVTTILESGASIRSCQAPESLERQHANFTFTVWAPRRRRRGQPFASQLAANLREIREIGQIIIT